jgi:SAM-dependent methyltransferase
MIEFDADTAAILERAYRGRDFVRRRHANLGALNPRAGETILDLGCGPGILLQELAAAVGAEGKAIGLDASPDMLAKARKTCAGEANVDIVEGRADALPFADSSIDGIISVQVFEYFHDLMPALKECARVLRPGGRLVIGDMHFDTFVMHSADPARHERMVRCWDGHFADRVVPARLLTDLPAAGLQHVETIPVTFVDTELRADGLAQMMKILMTRFALGTDGFDDSEARAWEAEQDALAEAGDFFFAITHMVTVAAKP